LQLGGPNWNVKLGRRDARTASQAAANNSIPRPTSNLNQLISSFSNAGLSTRDMVALSGLISPLVPCYLKSMVNYILKRKVLYIPKHWDYKSILTSYSEKQCWIF
jgi:hypothetical protein